MTSLPSTGSFKNLWTWSEEGERASVVGSTMSWSDWVGEEDEDDPANRPFSNTYTDDALAEGITGESPPIRAIDPGHVPRTDVTAEEFLLSKIGVTCMMDEHDSAKRVSSVQMPASAAGVKECDEIVAINSVDVQSVNAYECVEVCNQAARLAPTVRLIVRDFITMKLKELEVDVENGCPARKLARERGLESPISPLVVPPRAPPVRWEEESESESDGEEGSELLEERSRGIGVGGDAGRDVRSKEQHEVKRRRRRRWRLVRWVAYGVGGTFLVMGLAALFVLILTVNMEEERLARVVEVANALERWLQTIPLCSCTYSTRGTTYFLPLCRACRPQVIWYANTNSASGVGARASLCDLRPAWMLGTCQRSTETVKYLGRFGTSEECEAACLSYTVGTSVCRSFLYHRSSYPERRFRQSCFGITHNGWVAKPEHDVVSGRVFGPLAQVQRMLVWYVRQVRQRIDARWWGGVDGRPWEVAVAVLVAIGANALVVCAIRRRSGSPGRANLLRTASAPAEAIGRLRSAASEPDAGLRSRSASVESAGSSRHGGGGGGGGLLGLSHGRESPMAGALGARHRVSPLSQPQRVRLQRPPPPPGREDGKGGAAGTGEDEGALRLRHFTPKSHDAYHRKTMLPSMPPQLEESLEEGRWL